MRLMRHSALRLLSKSSCCPRISLLRAWRTIQRQPAALNHDYSTGGDKPDHTTSLQELFPDLGKSRPESRQHAGEISREHPRRSLPPKDDVPRLPLPSLEDALNKEWTLWKQSRSEERTRTGTKTKKKAPGKNKAKDHELFPTTAGPTTSKPVILVLQSLSKTLVEDDFRRIVPEGQHIQGWRNRGNFTQVIPARDISTLATRGWYYLVFPTKEAASIYQERLEHLYSLAKRFTPTSLYSPIPPAPGEMIDGEDVHALLQTYSLSPPSQSLSIRTEKSSSVPIIVDDILTILDAPTSPTTGSHYPTVVFGLDSRRIDFPSLYNALVLDSKMQGVPWGLVNHKHAYLPYDRTVTKETLLTDRRYLFPERWILSFEKVQDARRFVRTWHRRQFLLPEWIEYETQVNPAVALAELLW
ncbi:MAG: hypothetical protein M1834_001161 [Cirrosporium novae-zelandiae]|nr:MAG: hypothetical protein M1834_001161 [Cirrosporium novae-zelandiae]